jgi:hypothetical protein
MLTGRWSRALALTTIVWSCSPGGSFVLTGSGQAGGRPKGPVAVLAFRAIGDDGQPVVDLKPTDVALKVDGKTREIRSLEFVKIVGSGGGSAQPSLAAPFSTNAQAESGRDLLLVFDEESIDAGREQPMKSAIGHLLGTLSPRDRVGLISVRRGGAVVPLTNEIGTVRGAIAGIKGQSSSGTPPEDPCRAGIIIQALNGIVASITAESQATVVFFSAALASPDTQRQAQIGSSSGLCQLRTEDFQALTVNAARAPVNFYVVHILDGTKSQSSANILAAGLENIAGATGGELVRLTGMNDTALARITRETSAYYLASFDPEPSERGSDRRVDVRVSRDRVKVRVRPAIAIGKGEGHGGPPTPREMLRVPAVYRELPLRAAGYASRNAGDEQLKIVTLFETSDASAKLASAAVALFDDKDKLIRQWTAEPSDFNRSPVMSALTAPAGAYRLRVAAADTSGRVGTVDSNLRAELMRADPLRFSTLLLGIPQNRAFAAKLLFSDEDPAAVAYLEVYGTASGELAASIDLASSDQGTPIASVPATITASKTGDLRVAYGGFTISALQPGDYLVRVNVTLDGKPVGQVTRTLRKESRK